MNAKVGAGRATDGTSGTARSGAQQHAEISALPTQPWAHCEQVSAVDAASWEACVASTSQGAAAIVCACACVQSSVIAACDGTTDNDRGAVAAASACHGSASRSSQAIRRRKRCGMGEL